MTILTTARLRLIPFDESHLDGLFALNGDPVVMRYITGQPQTREQTLTYIEMVKSNWRNYGYSWWSFVEIATNELVGAGCIQHLARDPANPLEIGWRLKPSHWHRGFALEAARAMAAFGFEHTELLYAVCDPENTASAQVMQRLGMTYQGIQRWYPTDTATYSLSKAQFAVGDGNTAALP